MVPRFRRTIAVRSENVVESGIVRVGSLNPARRPRLLLLLHVQTEVQSQAFRVELARGTREGRDRRDAVTAKTRMTGRDFCFDSGVLGEGGETHGIRRVRRG